MSSSSAYNNVILKSLVQPQGVAAPKRVTQDDYTNADFSQTFKNINDNAQRKVDKPPKTAADKKAGSVDRKTVDHHKTGDSSRLAEQRAGRDKIAGKKADDKVDPKKIDNEKIDRKKIVKESNPEEKVKTETSGKLDHKTENKKSDDETISAKDGEDLQGIGGELVIAQASALPVVDSNSPLPMVPAINLTAPVANSEVAPQTSLNSDLEPTVNSVGTISAEENNSTAVVVPELALEVSAVKADSEAGSPAIVDDQPGTSNADDAQVVAVALPNVVGEKAPAELAEVQTTAGELLAPKVPAAKSSVSDSALKDIAGASEENSNALLDVQDGLVTDKTSATFTKNTNAADVLAKTDLKQVDVADDPKAVFEKMLQTVSKSVTREEGASINSAQNNTSHSSSLTDSFARFNDVQSPATRGFVVQTAVPVPVGQPQWSQAVGEKVLWLAAQNVSSAEINLHPKDLGPMQVKVSVNQEQTSVSFTSHHPMVREVLDQNLNRLRDMFSEQGLNLVNVDVSDKSFHQQQGEGKEQKGHTGTNSLNEEETVAAVSAIVQQRLVDHYA